MHWELMDRYLAGECSAAELAEVERWLAELPHRRALLEQLGGPGDVEVGEARATIWARLQSEVTSDSEYLR
jgi:anti-sigma factor RsiW